MQNGKTKKAHTITRWCGLATILLAVAGCGFNDSDTSNANPIAEFTTSGGTISEGGSGTFYIKFTSTPSDYELLVTYDTLPPGVSIEVGAVGEGDQLLPVTILSESAEDTSLAGLQSFQLSIDDDSVGFSVGQDSTIIVGILYQADSSSAVWSTAALPHTPQPSL